MMPLPDEGAAIATLAAARRLTQYLNAEQVTRLLEQLDTVSRAGGYGEVTLVLDKGRVRFYRTTLSVDNAPKNGRV